MLNLVETFGTSPTGVLIWLLKLSSNLLTSAILLRSYRFDDLVQPLSLLTVRDDAQIP